MAMHTKDLKPLEEGVPIYEPMVWKLFTREEPGENGAYQEACNNVIGLVAAFLLGGLFWTVVIWWVLG